MMLQVVNNLFSILFMMMMLFGIIKLVKVFIIGVGVVGFQVIVIVKCMGVNVLVYDICLVVVEQVELLGGKFLKIDIGEIG